MTTKAQADWLIAAVTADLGLAVVKGTPAWDRPATAASAYVEWRQLEPLPATRIGQTVTSTTTQFVVGARATNEVELWALVDSMDAMIKSRTEATISGARYRVAWDAVRRMEQGDEVIEALRYAALTICSMTR